LLGLGTFTGIGVLVTRGEFRNLLELRALGKDKRDFTVLGKTTLRERAVAKKLIYGGASKYSILSSDVKFATQFTQESGILMAEADLLWNLLHPSPNSFNFTPGDWLADFARTNRMLFGGTHLVWHKAMPQWFETTVNSQNARKVLLKHISKVVRHYAGRVHLWTVVNEAVLPGDGRSNGLRNTPWLQLLGPNYIEIAFRAAARADPQALLLYNDNRMDYDTPEQEAKRTAVLKLLERLKSREVPVHALGMQAHLRGEESRFNAKKLKAFLHDVAAIGLKILITEMDVRDRKLPRNIDVRDRIVARCYEDYLSVVLDEPAVNAVITWGLSDRYSWLSWAAPREDGAPVRPLPLAANLNRKLAWNAIARSFDNAYVRESLMKNPRQNSN